MCHSGRWWCRRLLRRCRGFHRQPCRNDRASDRGWQDALRPDRPLGACGRAHRIMRRQAMSVTQGCVASGTAAEQEFSSLADTLGYITQPRLHSLAIFPGSPAWCRCLCPRRKRIGGDYAGCVRIPREVRVYRSGWQIVQFHSVRSTPGFRAGQAGPVSGAGEKILCQMGVHRQVGATDRARAPAFTFGVLGDRAVVSKIVAGGKLAYGYIDRSGKEVIPCPVRHGFGLPLCQHGSAWSRTVNIHIR